MISMLIAWHPDILVCVLKCWLKCQNKIANILIQQPHYCIAILLLLLQNFHHLINSLNLF
jgi:hypothetical protein